MKTIIQDYNGQEVSFEIIEGEVMINANEMARSFKKRLYKFTKSQSTKELIEALVEDRKEDSNYPQMGVVESQIIYTKEGQHGGTFMCEDLALAFAMWLDPKFHVWVLKTFRKVIFGNNPNLVMEAVMNLPGINKNLRKLRRERSKLKNLLLGSGRTQRFSELVSKRVSIDHQITQLAFRQSNPELWDNPAVLGREFKRLIEERDEIIAEINNEMKFQESRLNEEKYLNLCDKISGLEKQSRSYSLDIRNSESLFSEN